MQSRDHDLVERALRGEEPCFEEIIRRHEHALWASLRRLLDPEDAREVFQETWLRVWRRLDGLRDVERLRSWVLSIGINLARSHHRRRGRRGAEQSWVECPDSNPAHDPGGALERSELVQRLQQEMEQLPPRQREVVDLRLNHELDHRAIAEALGISVEASRANYYQALRRLKERCGAFMDVDNPRG